MSESTGHHEIPKEELTESNFSPVRTCTGTYGVAELVEFKGTGGQVSCTRACLRLEVMLTLEFLKDLDCVRVKVGELSGPLDLDPL